MGIRYPQITVNLDVLKTNAEVICDLCGRNGISVAGIIKFSDGNPQVAGAYVKGGCAQLGVSRASHLKLLKMVYPEKELLLTRSPGRHDLEATARWADLSLHADETVLRALNEEVAKWSRTLGILLMLNGGVSQMPERINHLRIGGAIANPMNIRLNRGVTFPGLREDGIRLRAEIVELHEKNSAPGETTKNWAGEIVVREDKGRRLQAILALGSQDVGNPSTLIPLEEGLSVMGSSSDHTIVDVTDSPRQWKVGDVVEFQPRYGNMLYAFSGKHVSVKCRNDWTKDQ